MARRKQKGTLLVLDVEDRDFHTMEIPTDIGGFYKHLKCDCFDIVTRKIGGVVFDIFCDDEGLFKENAVVSAITGYWEPALVGNLIFAHSNAKGETVGISEEDMMIIKKHSVFASMKNAGEEDGERIILAVQFDK